MAEYLPALMFISLVILLFTGYPVAFVLGGTAIVFGAIAILMGEMNFMRLFTLVPRVWGGIAENLILVSIPMFIFMGNMLERAGLAKDLLFCLEVLLRRVPGGLALAVTLMGTIMAASTGIVGASVIMLTLLAMPAMMQAGYSKKLASGTIAASGTLGILIPPSIMLVIMADLLAKSVGTLFFAAFFPGLALSGLYLLYIVTVCGVNRKLAPPLPRNIGPQTTGALLVLVVVAFLPPCSLIFLVLGSILLGWATPTEAAGVGAFGALVLALVFKPLIVALFGDLSIREAREGPVRLAGTFAHRYWADLRKFPGMVRDVAYDSALFGGMLFLIFVGATAFSYVFDQIGGNDQILGAIKAAQLGPWGVFIALMALIFVLGFFFDWIEIVLIILPVFAPVINALDFGDHVAKKDVVYWFAICMAVNLQTSFLTPPFGFSLFYMRGTVPPGVSMGDIYAGIVPFVGLQLIGLALTIVFPGIAMWLPNRYLQ
jgi:TRAP-type mannitol/chloroaromatic compound transport system permease large subunit